VGRPERLDLASILWHFLTFRREVVARRLAHELGILERRIHILDGFVTVFDALDEILRMIRASDGKADAAAKLMKRFKLDDEQADAILELRIYRLAKLEILVIQEERDQKRKEAKKIKGLLSESSGAGIWNIVRGEINELKGTGGPRRTELRSLAEEPEFSVEELIVAEDAHVLVTRDGWVKRQKEIKDPGATRLREGDEVLACVAGSTRATVVFFSNFGTAYTCRIIDVPATSGYGEPIQKLFKLKDGESVVAALSLDPRLTGDVAGNEQTLPETYAAAASSDGFALCFGLGTFVEPSTRSGRRFARLPEGAAIIGVSSANGAETVIAASKSGRALLCSIADINYLSGPGRGVTLMKLADDDALIGVKLAHDERDTLVCKTSLGGEQRINTGKYEVSQRGGKGREIIKRGHFTSVVLEPPPAPAPFEADTAGQGQ
jgi:DNA gyrase subunit A